MRFEIVLAPETVEELRVVDAYVRSTVLVIRCLDRVLARKRSMVHLASRTGTKDLTSLSQHSPRRFTGVKAAITRRLSRLQDLVIDDSCFLVTAQRHDFRPLQTSICAEQVLWHMAQ